MLTGIFGTAIATMGMLATCAYILAMDTFGPITDNAGGIVEMSGAPEEIRKNTDRLDAVGNYHQGSDQRICCWFCCSRGLPPLLGLY